jgi:hypothetical protein
MFKIAKLNANKLQKKILYDYYIHIKDHNKKINPVESKLRLSYMSPKILVENSPIEK